jgi:hypothetical protein
MIDATQSHLPRRHQTQRMVQEQPAMASNRLKALAAAKAEVADKA